MWRNDRKCIYIYKITFRFEHRWVNILRTETKRWISCIRHIQIQFLGREKSLKFIFRVRSTTHKQTDVILTNDDYTCIYIYTYVYICRTILAINKHIIYCLIYVSNNVSALFSTFFFHET